ASIENTALLIDWRNYYRLGLRTAYAIRFQGRVSDGSGAQRFTLGGSYSLRGFPRRALYGTRSLLLNQEVRFPLLDGVVLGFPFGRVGLPGVQGAIFGDVGQAWEESEGFFPNPYGSFGFGLRSSFGGFLILRLDIVRTTNFEVVSRDTDVIFFIGTNY
ncbi:MAG: WD40 domain protein beta propeller, partial [bacterium]